MIYVCPLSKVAETAAVAKASHLVSLINEGTPVTRPTGILEENHLFLAFNDITQPMDGFTPPDQRVVQTYLDFIDHWSGEDAIVIHCFAGISRSTAAGFVAACRKRPDASERAIAETLRAAAPQATPNSLFVSIADDLMGRRGRMVDAIKRIGRGANAFEGSPFSLSTAQR